MDCSKYRFFFGPGGPLGGFRPVSPEVLQRHIRRAEVLARTIYDRDHSNGAGEDHEDTPEWVQAFFCLFEALNNQETPNQRAANVRNERNSVAASIVGRQAPLGVGGGDGPVQLRNETSRNNGNPEMRRQVVGRVTVERVNLQEGRDDSATRIPAPRNHTSNGTRRRNVHIAGFSPERNDPSARFNNIIGGYESMNRLTDAIAQSFVAPQQSEIRMRGIIDIVREFTEVANLLQNAPPEQHDFYRRAMSVLHNEMVVVESGNENNDIARNSGENNNGLHDRAGHDNA